MKYILLLTIALSFVCCRSTKQVSPDLTKVYLKFGSEGGVTGNGTFYYLFENGNLYSLKTIGKTYVKLKSIGASKAKDLFSQTQASGFYDLNFSQKGNMTYRIESTVVGKAHTVTWTDQDKPSDAVLKLYQELNLITNQK